MGYYGFLILAIGLSMVGAWVKRQLQSKFRKYYHLPLGVNLSGAQVAAKMLVDYGINDVKIQQGKGMLTDHYNPLTKTVTLSPAVYQGRNVAAAAVAAHESGHAIQHATAYSMLQLRSALVPIIKVAAGASQFLLIGAFIFIETFPELMLFAVVAFALTSLFSFITLPVEFDASKRALNWLEDSRVTSEGEYDGAKEALWWAAMTYVAQALTSLVMVLYLLGTYLSSRK
ncbi:MAG: zinc metallopeptidase [Bacteroidota bacterium]